MPIDHFKVHESLLKSREIRGNKHLIRKRPSEKCGPIWRVLLPPEKIYILR